VSPALDALRKDVEVENPPIKKLLAFANQALEEGHVPAAIWGYKRVMSREPKNVEAITQIGLILAQGNHMDQGLARIDEAISIDAKYPKAYWNKANILFHGKGDFAGAAASLETYLKLVPTGEHAEQARTLLAEARTQAANGGKARAATPAAKPGAGPAR
jgi:outer membrane protein assembly factor BamD (BamD/ComL family)